MDEAVENLDVEFADLLQRSRDLVSRLSSEKLYARPNGCAESVGERLMRSAAIVEQSFGGLMANLWDDPYEWTLPETLNTPAKVIEYLDEVETTRRQAFDAFKTDGDLSKEIMTPGGAIQLRQFLLDTLRRARHHQQRARAIFELLKE